ncbi:hypothetical protein NM688_g3037 [Phlebia brevispora]|uniref:Uncharacterized protein n=1 Tax=Phlebia brevispora TaxID=194682 RepID=A0ACC1T6Y6_9APHY|nr:hypothetical protein NM688_g3037 [Phlebia brevispora]
MDEHQAIELKKQYNATLPVSRIPPELVSRIIFLDQPVYDSPMWLTLAWIRLTHVYQYWRTVALNTPGLWCHIPVYFGGLDIMLEWLRRAKQTPLVVDPWPEHRSDDVVDAARVEAYNLALAELSHIRELELTLPGPLFPELRWPDYTADQLETLWIYVSSPSAPFEIPTAVKFSNLTALYLSGVHKIWGQGVLPPSLKKLQIELIDDPVPPKSCRLEEVLADLKELPLLESLELINALPLSDTSYSTSIKLPKLLILDLEDSNHHTTALLDHISLPSCIHLAIHCCIYETSMNLTDTLVSVSGRLKQVMMDALKRGQVVRASCLEFNDRSVEPSLEVSCWTSEVSFDDRDTHEADKPDFYVRFWVEGAQVTLEGMWLEHLDALPRFCDSLPLESTVNLDMDGWPLYRGPIMIAWFNLLVVKFQKVRRLRIKANPFSDAELALPVVLRFVVPEPGIKHDCTNPKYRQFVAFPAMEELRLTQFKFRASSVDLQNFCPRPFVEALSDCLAGKEAHTTSLIVNDCYDVTEQDIEHLRTAGSHSGLNVQWDGIEQAAQSQLLAHFTDGIHA